jgi:hypothetical protein
VLIAADDERDPEAEWPSGAATTADEDEDEDDETPPPAAARVARRAVVLTAVSARGVIERDFRYNGDSVEDARRKLATVIGWLDQLGLDDELEPEERRVLEAQPGELELQDAINALWRVEGLAVLAWALRLSELPRYDQVADIDALWPAIGFLDADRARALLDRPELRPADELDGFGDQMLGYHWRLRDYGLRPQAMDYRAFAANCWFGSFDLSPFELIDGDLAIAGQRIDRCDRQALGTASSIAQERHLAINWLRGGDEVYSETDTST